MVPYEVPALMVDLEDQTSVIRDEANEYEDQ